MKTTLKQQLIEFLSRAAVCFAGECGHSGEASKKIGEQVASSLQSLPQTPNSKES